MDWFNNLRPSLNIGFSARTLLDMLRPNSYCWIWKYRRKRELGKLPSAINAGGHGRPVSVANKPRQKQTVHKKQRERMDRASGKTLRSTPMA